MKPRGDSADVECGSSSVCSLPCCPGLPKQLGKESTPSCRPDPHSAAQDCVGRLSAKVHVGEQNPDPVPRPTGTHCLAHPPSLCQCSACARVCTSGVCGVCICLYLRVRGCVSICVGETPWQKAQAGLVAMSAPQAARLKPQSGEVYRGPGSAFSLEQEFGMGAQMCTPGRRHSWAPAKGGSSGVGSGAAICASHVCGLVGRLPVIPHCQGGVGGWSQSERR